MIRSKRIQKRKGFTTVELIVVITAVLLLLGTLTVGIVEYTRYANFKGENESARSLFTAAQLQLTVDSQRGQLGDLRDAAEPNTINLSLLTDSNGQPVTAETLWGDSDRAYQGTLRYLYGTGADYEQFLAGTLDEGSDAYQLYTLLDAYLYDKSVLEDCVLIELDPYDGLVYSVFCCKTCSGFTYGVASDGIINICDRTPDTRKENLVGYYGVDSLSKATSTEAQKPVISDVTLHNEETLHLSFRLSKVPEALYSLNYEIIIHDAETKNPLMALEFNDTTLCTDPFDTSNYLLVAENAAAVHTVEAKAVGYANCSFTDGIYTFPAYITEDGVVTLIFDAVDMGSAPESAELANTFSMERFHIDAESVYCTVQGSGNGYKTTAKKQSNTEHLRFGKYTQSPSGITYSIMNGRHLYNIRFRDGVGDGNVTYAVATDFSWTDMLQGGFVYRDKNTLQTTGGYAWISSGTSPNINRIRFRNSDLLVSPLPSGTVPTDAQLRDAAFPSFPSLSSNSVLRSASLLSVQTVDGLIINHAQNTHLNIPGDRDVTGLFLHMNGAVEALSFDRMVVVGENFTGAVAGICSGTMSGVSLLSTDGASSVSGLETVGGLIGNADVDISLERLINRAAVHGTRYVGGIISHLSAGEDKTLTVTDCRNYGQISGDDSFIGGITGAITVSSNGAVSLNNCISSPFYSEQELFAPGSTLLLDAQRGKYVGGIVGKNEGGTLTGCQTLSDNGKVGYVLGDTFVGGIAGYNSGVLLDGGDGMCKNQNNVIGHDYVGGIVGVNAALIADVPSPAYTEDYEIRNWVNEGIVLATGHYAGGIAGYNTGRLIHCNSDVSYTDTARELETVVTSKGNYVGGIAGYNNGVITSDGDVLEVVSVLDGQNYVGGIVGYNDNGIHCEISGYELQGGYIFGNTFVGGYIGLNRNAQPLDGENASLVANANRVEGKFCIGGIIGGNLLNHNSNLVTLYNTYNILGDISGDQFVGGFIGYNLMSTGNDDIIANVRDAIVNGLGDNMAANIQLLNSLNVFESDRVLVVNGHASEQRSIRAKTYVGGVIGYCDPLTYLLVRDVINRTPIYATESLPTHEMGPSDTTLYSYAGGVTGRIDERTIVYNCNNEGIGEVHNAGTYTGSIAELNAGMILNCSAVSLGNRTVDHIGGIVGVNLADADIITFGTGAFVNSYLPDGSHIIGANEIATGIYSCDFRATVTGRNEVGGISARNLGLIDNPLINGSVVSYGENAGGICGKNEGTVILRTTAVIQLIGNASHAGGLVGDNHGTLQLEAPFDASLPSALDTAVGAGSFISGKTAIGGIIGIQSGSQTLNGFTNEATVVATLGNAGGIVGGIAFSGSLTISDCINNGSVSSTLDGNAGGITAAPNENSTILRCENHADVFAANGCAGGITSINTGNITACTVSGSGRILSITALTTVGGLSAINRGTIENSRVISANITNLVASASRCNLGGAAGENTGTISFSSDADALLNITVQTYSDKCSLGGVVGLNLGTVAGNGTAIGNKESPVHLSFASNLPNYACMGGVAGDNIDSVSGCRVYSNIEGFRGDGTFPTVGYGGIAGRTSGTVLDCSFDGYVYANGNSSFIAPVGGISGLNSGTIEQCVVGTSDGDTTVIQCANTDSGYGYVGGLCGFNKGLITSCDNYADSDSTVYVINYAGHTGGLVGRNYNQSTVTGVSADDVTSTGDDWTVIVLGYDNDCGAGGIMGYSASGTSFSYVRSYADVFYNINSSNVSLGGIIGRMENAEQTDTVMTEVENHGNLYAKGALVGGFIGTLKYNALTFDHCRNMGRVGSNTTVVKSYVVYNGQPANVSFLHSSSAAGGFIARTFAISQDDRNICSFLSCENHGAIFGSNAAGFAGTLGTMGSVRVNLSDCVNTGCIYGSSSGAGFVTSHSSGWLSFIRCRNYGLCGLSGKLNNFAGLYFGGSISPSKIEDCFDCSNATKYPIANKGANITGDYYVSLNGGTHTVTETVKKDLFDSFTVGCSESDAALTLPLSTGSTAPCIQSSYPLSNSVDGTIGTQVRLTMESTSYLSTSTPLYLRYQLKNPVTADTLDIHFATPSTMRIYSFQVFVQYAGDAEMTQIGGNYTVSTPASANATVKQSVSLSTQKQITAFRIDVYDAKNGSVNTQYVVYDDVSLSLNGVAYDLGGANINALILSSLPVFSGLNLSNGNSNQWYYTNGATNSDFMYDGNPETSVGWGVNRSAVSFESGLSFWTVLNMRESAHIDTVALTFNLSGKNNETHIYYYRLYYLIEGSADWVEATAGSSDPLLTASYDPSLHCYRAEISGSVYKTFHHSLNLNDGTNISAVKVEFLQQTFTTPTSSIPTPSDRYLLGEVELFASEERVVMDNPGATVAIGSPIVPEEAVGSQPNFSLNGTNISLTNILASFRTGYESDLTDYAAWSNGGESPRYALYTAMDAAVVRYLHNKYNSYDGNISITSQTNVGNNTFKVAWSSTEAAYRYDVGYSVTSAGGDALVNFGDAAHTYRLSETSRNIGISELYQGCTIQFAVRAVYLTDAGGVVTENYSEWFTGTPFRLTASLPVPQLVLELVEPQDNVFRYKVVLQNPDAYTPYGAGNVQINVCIDDDVVFFASAGESEPFVMNQTYSGALDFSAHDTTNTYSDSVKRTVWTSAYSPSSLISAPIAYTTFNGFYGSTTEDLYYTATLRANAAQKPETYFYVELVTYDEAIDADIAVSFGECHVTQYGQPQTASLANLPADMMQRLAEHPDSSITIRSYPWRNQAFMCYMGNTLASEITAAEVRALPIFDADHHLLSGYSVQKNSNGTYTVIYSVILANPDYTTFACQIESNVYTAADITIEPTPVISPDFTYTAQTDSYTFSWDNGPAANGQLYQYILTGIAADGTTVELASDTTDAHSATFAATEWNYPNVTLSVTHLGTTNADGKVLTFASSAERSFNIKVHLPQISAPIVEFHRENGIVVKDNLVYDISWIGIDNDQLDCYEVTVQHSKEGHITKITFVTGETTGTIEQDGVITGTIPLNLTEKTAVMLTADLNALEKYGGDRLEISVRAIAKADSLLYSNSIGGVVRNIPIPTRLATPNLDNLQFQATPVVSAEALAVHGVNFTMSQTYTDRGNYEMIAEIVDSSGNHVADVTYSGVPVSASAPISMLGSLSGASLQLTGISADYAGYYLKVSLRAVSDSNISSVWTFDDDNVPLYKIFRLPFVKLDTPALTETKCEIINHMGSDDEVDWATINQTALTFETVEYAQEYHFSILESPQSVYIRENENHRASGLWTLRVVKTDDGYTVYATGTDDDVYGDGDEHLVGVLADGETLTLPYAVQTDLRRDLDAPIGSDLATVAAELRLDGDTFTLVLPDCDDLASVCTQNVTVTAVTADNEHYISSAFANWYRIMVGEVLQSMIESFETAPAAPTPVETDITVTVTDAPGKCFELSVTTDSRVIIEVSGDLDDDGVSELVRRYAVPGNELGITFDSVLQFDSDVWAEYAGRTVTIRMRHIIATQGISDWSEPITVTFPPLQTTLRYFGSFETKFLMML